ncbi:benzoate 4-monooxygenase cytochrome P450 [Hypoxylon crocopeplum]|nr:benzoate 4-monooxygenase cytochrome P450 [Hypoxylon crocopeplum]
MATELSYNSFYLVACLIGVAAHLKIFIKGECHLRAPTIVVVHLIAIVSLPTILARGTPHDVAITFPIAVKLFATYSFGLFSSISIYRLFFHRLKGFPGPRIAALTKLWHVYKCRHSRNHLELDTLHKQYGTFVRTGPEEITIFHPGIFEAMDGALNNNTRSDWYDIIHPRVSPIFSREDCEQRERRKVWNQALSIPQHAVDKYGKNLVPVNDVMQWFAFDSMGEFAFNSSFDMLKTGAWHKAIVQQRTALAMLGWLNPAIWAIRLAFFFAPNVWPVKAWFDIIDFCDTCMKKRIQTSTTEPDIASWFIEEFNSSKDEIDLQKRQDLHSGNTVSVIVGGSDTTGPSLILLWYFLALYPEHAERIHDELATIDTNDIIALTALPHLNGFINESMRLIPAALTMGSRVTPSEGIMIDGTFIPGKVKIVAPRYTIFRMETAFENALSFIPERWYSQSELIKDRRAFAPFGLGRRACVGKNLALASIRLVTAKLLTRYRVRFPPGTNGEAVERDMRDQLTAQPGRFSLLFEER